MDRKRLTREAMQAATDLRDRLDLDPFGPVDPYRASHDLGVKVMLLGTSMEGFYVKGAPSRILLSSLRPVPRRAFTCAHELGHHVFGHGSSMDVLQEDERREVDKPEEVIANAFAAFFLMPTVGLRGAFARRDWTIAAATPLQFFTVACQFGVGYLTLINHLHYTRREITAARREGLARCTPQRLRRQLLEGEHDALLLVDERNEAATFDAEKGTAVLLPPGVRVEGNALVYVRSHPEFDQYLAAKRGCATVAGLDANFDVRVMPKEYVGAAINRFLEDPDEED